MQVPVSFEDAFFGNDVSINYNREEMDTMGNLIPQEHYTIESLRVNIPAGSCLGLSRSFKGKGIKSGEEVGDAEVHVVVNRHPRFQADEKGNILAQESIPLDILLKGGKIEVQTMYGLRTLKIAPGTRPGARLPIKNCGARNMGDHIVICNPLYPTAEDLQKEAWKGLDINWQLDEEIRKEEEQDRKNQQFARFAQQIKVDIDGNNFKFF
jgi:DnaJ-class molecular chaperone